MYLLVKGGRSWWYCEEGNENRWTNAADARRLLDILAANCPLTRLDLATNHRQPSTASHGSLTTSHSTPSYQNRETSTHSSVSNTLTSSNVHSTQLFLLFFLSIFLVFFFSFLQITWEKWSNYHRGCVQHYLGNL